ncbi:DUF433 domain-containing protein [Leptolyngbya cf. ectocarpi LEGE 11479]|uniref:DUF433 domain-containing protein n=1 Tax=Leptolyngbya cf. ectocarpi LEGE 11479 TaxID=1828722 RepID=A0A928X3S4_LEPEC|nr:DUF433 domain-containing protein [Leptolyngbya ectocarpi]MBE9067069.1 DUF433 domain-containing protein [Leptolyngbya cf. ectocarpi LEGE 11479]
MTFEIIADPPPLEVNPDNVVLVGKTRVTLDTVVAIFKQGATAEEIVHRYPTLKLADVYSTIAFYLNHQQMVETYLAERQSQSGTIQQLNEARLDPNGIRDRLLNRKHAQEAC